MDFLTKNRKLISKNKKSLWNFKLDTWQNMNKRLSLTYRMKTILIRLKKVEWYINQTVYTVGGNWDMKKTGIILGALLLAAGLTGCGGEKKEEAAKAPE